MYFVRLPIADLLGFMKELSPDIPVTALQQRAEVAPGTRIFIAENDEKHIVGCATLCVFESPTGRKASAEDVVVLQANRGQWIGPTLLRHIIDFAGSKLSPIDLHLTSPRTPHARRPTLSRGAGLSAAGYECV